MPVNPSQETIGEMVSRLRSSFDLHDLPVLNEAADLIEAMAKVLEKLPLTADGVPVLPGMTIYPPCGHGKPLTPDCFIPVRVKEVSCWEGSCHHAYYGENDYHESDPTKYPVGKCYSTREAAEQSLNPEGRKE